jgi:molybdenum cofactor cytidylyltransferase
MSDINKPDAIILAAGSSKRMGLFKLGLFLGDKTVIERSIEGMYDLCSRIIVVGGYEIDKIKKILKVYSKIKIVYNSEYEKGMFTSVKAGLRYVERDSFFIQPGDMPLIKKEVYYTMLNTNGNIVVPVHRNKSGHPVYFKSHLIPEILDQPDDTTLRDFIDRKGHRIIDIDDNGITIDIDNMADYQRLKEKFEINNL